MNDIAVLGCGPAGLLAAHAVVRSGHRPIIYSIGERSDLPGTMYLHKAIPDLTSPEPDGTVTYVKRGNKEAYAQKVYNNQFAPCSWDNFPEGDHPAWSARATYDMLWRLYSSEIRAQPLTAWDLDALASDYRLVISSIPATVLCRKPYHHFNFAEIWISREAHESVEPGQIVYNGVWDQMWYRSCDIFGYQATEFGKMKDDVDKPPLPRGIKPISTNCDCTDRYRNVLRVGRFGRWKKGELIHHAFERSMSILEA